MARIKSLEMPGFIKPQLATLKSKAPVGSQWLHEIKFDGYRVQVHLNKGKRKVYTRNGLDWTKRFSVIAGALDIPGQAIVDGEVVVIHEGRTNFSELQAELAAGRQDRLVFYAFDLLWRDGDLRQLLQIERKQNLSDLLGENGIEAPIVYSEHLIGDGHEMFEHAAKLGWEGIVSKNAEAPYRSDRNEAWLKIKTVQKGQFPVIGFVKDPTGVAALYLGKREGKDLVYMGKVGTGWSRTVSSQIRKQLDTVVSPKSKLTKALITRGGHDWTKRFPWVAGLAEPQLIHQTPVVTVSPARVEARTCREYLQTLSRRFHRFVRGATKKWRSFPLVRHARVWSMITFAGTTEIGSVGNAAKSQ